MSVWYPLDVKIENLEEVNNRCKGNDFAIVEVVINDSKLPLPSNLEKETVHTITQSFDRLKSRLD